ncbi:MAG TPA: hypothetical protein VFK86_08625, partial [Bauldia sp.]|nr:hypothetical protein [Bauldia sp.]
DGIITSTDDFMQRAAEASENIQGVIAEAETIATNLKEFSTGLNATLKDVNEVVAGIDPAKVSTAVDNITGFSDQLKTVTPEVNTIVADAKAAVAGARDFAENLTTQKDNLNAIVADAKELAARLNEASTKIDTVLGKAEEVLGDEDGVGRNFFQEAAGAAKALREVAESFNARSDEIAAGLASFSGRGLADVSALVNELRASVARIDRAVADFARNPGGAVLGGNSGVRDYNRR